jgi:hypothetical protein
MSVEAARREVYRAVIDGRIQAWRKGRLLSSARAKALKDQRPTSTVNAALERGALALPADLELRAEDVNRWQVKPKGVLWVWNRPQETARSSTGHSELRKRGPKPLKLEEAKREMRADIREGRHTPADLRNMTDKGLVATYEFSRQTLRRARDAVLSEFQIGTKDK